MVKGNLRIIIKTGLKGQSHEKNVSSKATRGLIKCQI